MAANDEFDEVLAPSEIAGPDIADPALMENVDNSAGQKVPFLEMLLMNIQRSGDMIGGDKFTGELICLAMIFVWILCYLYGRMANEKIAVNWINTYKSYFDENFAFMSSASTAKPDPNALLHRETLADYSFFASGRVNCAGMYLEINLLKRHDVVMRVIDALAFPFHDKVTIQIPLNPNVDSIFLLAVCRKGKQEAFRSQRKEFQEFSPQVSTSLFSSAMIVMCEAPDAIQQLFDSQAMKCLGDLEDMIELICVSDLNAEPVEGFNVIPAKLLTFTFRLLDPSNPEKMRPLVELAVRLVDTIHQMKLSGSSKGKVEKNRKILAE
ncbi:ccdc47, partial [Symbiodinium microadriaticum]